MSDAVKFMEGEFLLEYFILIVLSAFPGGKIFLCVIWIKHN